MSKKNTDKKTVNKKSINKSNININKKDFIQFGNLKFPRNGVDAVLMLVAWHGVDGRREKGAKRWKL